jgi:hypothetical protein
MLDRKPDPLALRSERTARLTLTLPDSTLLALYHYCLSRDADAHKMTRAASSILTAFLSRDATLKRWRAAQGASLPATVPSRSKCGGRRA